jgi:nucleotide-binding universal stress UspA family protein
MYMGDFKIAPIPFDRIAVAVTLSPRVEEMVSEGFYFAKAFNAKLYFIHIGVASDSLKLKPIFDKYNHHSIAYEFIHKEGDVVDTLLEITKQNYIDLLIAGALQKESPWRYIMGSVSRSICRKAKCSVLMLNEPSLNPHGYSKMVVNCIDHPKTASTIDSAIYFANHLAVNDMMLVKEDDMYSVTSLAETTVCEDELEGIKRAKIIEERQTLDALHLEHQFGALKVNFKMLKGKPGKEITHFAREADLLVVNSPDQELGLLQRLFPHGLEHALEDLPCSLLIIHSRTQSSNA